MIYGYARVSTQHQRLSRQITNILDVEPNAVIIKEHYTGTTLERPAWTQLVRKLAEGDTVIFDSVSRFARNAKEGFEEYKKMFELGVNLVFINEPLINTSVFAATRNNLLHISVETGNEAVDEFFSGNIALINKFLMSLAEEQIKKALEQSEKEVSDLHSRISQGMREAKKNGTKIGLSQGTTLITKKSLQCKSIIQKHCKDFGGSLEDPDVMKLCGCSRNSYYKYKRELKSKSNTK
ncbi:MAG: recombinase family protein [Ruminococcaceae bacterium]|nr:recombinase family protein [Oscillospiraceae bacterium]